MTNHFETFSVSNFKFVCDKLATGDSDIAAVIRQFGYPPMWTRPNTFETLVHFILEQQVSLPSAKAALEKLRETIRYITAERVLQMSDEQLRACYFSRQKLIYVKSLAKAIFEKQIDLAEFETMPDTLVREKLIILKGIGNWTIDVYQMFVLHHADIFPIGDLAQRNAFIKIKSLTTNTSKEKILELTGSWTPYRSVAAMILWHYYLSTRSSKRGKSEVNAPV